MADLYQDLAYDYIWEVINDTESFMPQESYSLSELIKIDFEAAYERAREIRQDLHGFKVIKK